MGADFEGELSSSPRPGADVNLGEPAPARGGADFEADEFSSHIKNAPAGVREFVVKNVDVVDDDDVELLRTVLTDAGLVDWQITKIIELRRTIEQAALVIETAELKGGGIRNAPAFIFSQLVKFEEFAPDPRIGARGKRSVANLDSERAAAERRAEAAAEARRIADQLAVDRACVAGLGEAVIAALKAEYLAARPAVARLLSKTSPLAAGLVGPLAAMCRERGLKNNQAGEGFAGPIADAPAPQSSPGAASV